MFLIFFFFCTKHDILMLYFTNRANAANIINCRCTDINFTVIQIIYYYSLYLLTIFIKYNKTIQITLLLCIPTIMLICQLHINCIVIYLLHADRFEQNLMSCYLLTRFSILCDSTILRLVFKCWYNIMNTFLYIF